MSGPPAGWWKPLIFPLAVAGLLIGLLYYFLPYASGYADHRISIFKFAYTLWNIGEDWQHCYLVPFAAAAMVYYKRRTLAATPVRGSWLGLVVTAFALFVYWVGFRADNVYLGYFSLQILLAGMVLWLFGVQWMKVLLFAWAFLAFLYPLTFLDNLVAFPLRVVMSHASEFSLNVVGIPTIRSGTAILSAPDMLANLKAGERFSVDVADPCSGIRSLFALMMVSALYGYFTQNASWKMLVLFAFSMPLAVAGNLARIMMLTIGTLALGSDVAIGTLDDPSTFHMAAGFLVFAVALVGLLGIGRALNTDWIEVWMRVRTQLHHPPPPPPPPGSGTASRPRNGKLQEEY